MFITVLFKVLERIPSFPGLFCTSSKEHAYLFFAQYVYVYNGFVLNY